MYLSMAGSAHINWILATDSWNKMPNLKVLDVNRTNIVHHTVFRFLSSLKSLKVLCALNCPLLEQDISVVAANDYKGKNRYLHSFTIFLRKYPPFLLLLVVLLQQRKRHFLVLEKTLEK